MIPGQDRILEGHQGSLQPQPMEQGRPKPLAMHRFKLDDTEATYGLFGQQCDGVLKVAITP
jgi:hypothetical protein